MVFTAPKAVNHFSRNLTFKGVGFKREDKVHPALIKGSHKNVSSCSYISGHSSARLWPAGEGGAMSLWGWLHCPTRHAGIRVHFSPRGQPSNLASPWLPLLAQASEEWIRSCPPGSLKSLDVHTLLCSFLGLGKPGLLHKQRKEREFAYGFTF